jgi:hypothetical protein
MDFDLDMCQRNFSMLFSISTRRLLERKRSRLRDGDGEGIILGING